VLFLLVTGTFLYIDALRTLISSFKWELRQIHSIVGTFYFVFLLAASPYAVQYVKRKKHWTKAFHICLMFFLGLGWTASGLYLWLNITAFLGLRQASITMHDALSLFFIPWIAGHIGLWYLRKTKPTWILKKVRSTKKPQPTSVPRHGPTGALYRRDVLILFSGSVAALFLGGLARWYQPISERFLATLDTVKRRGYFRIYSLRNENPFFDRATWRLVVDGLVERPLALRFDELIQIEKLSYVHDFHCVTGWSVLGVQWEGVPFQVLAKTVQYIPEAKYVKLYSADQLYTETYEISQLMQQNVLLAYQIDGKPLSPDQGAPLRLFQPDMFGYKSIKWLNRIEFTDQRGQGYWEEKEGYDLNGYIA
jgi:hypothetical protein